MKDTRKSLAASGLALLVSAALLVGTTFAWFTDSVVNKGNKIQAGNLKVDLIQLGATLNDEQEKEIGETIDEDAYYGLKNVEAPVFDYELWEPGYTVYKVIGVRNTGDLALKFDLDIVPKGELGALADVIDVYGYTSQEAPTTGSLAEAFDGFDSFSDVLENQEYITAFMPLGTLASRVEQGLLTGQLNNPQSTVYWVFVFHMRESAGNEYQGASIGTSFDIVLNATQNTVEKDGFGNKDYDEDAQYPDVAYVAVSAPTAEDSAAGVNPLADALTSAAAEEDTATGEAKQKIVADLAAGAYTLTDKEDEAKTATAGKEITLVGAGAENTTFAVKKTNVNGEANATYCFDGTKAVVFKNMTVEFGLNTDFQGFVRAGAVRFENCTIKGMGANWGIGDVVFDNCNFVFPEGGNEYTYNLWTYGGSSFTFNNCTFTSNIGRFINVYRQGNDGVVDVALNKCKFINNASSATKAAVKINGDHAWNVTINNCTTEGHFPADNDGLWEIENAVAGNRITVNGVQAYSR